MPPARSLAYNYPFPSSSLSLFFLRGPTLYQMVQPPREGVHQLCPPCMLETILACVSFNSTDLQQLRGLERQCPQVLRLREQAANRSGAQSKKSPNLLQFPLALTVTGNSTYTQTEVRIKSKWKPPPLPPPQKKKPKMSLICGDTSVGIWEKRCVAGRGQEDPPRLWNEETAPSHRLSATSSTPRSPQHQLHCLGTEGTKAQPREFREGGNQRCEPRRKLGQTRRATAMG